MIDTNKIRQLLDAPDGVGDGLIRDLCDEIDILFKITEECEYALDLAEAEQYTSTPQAWEEILKMGNDQYDILRVLIYEYKTGGKKNGNT